MSDECTLWCGNLSNNITEELLYELFLQAGPLKKVSLPRDASGKPRSYAFITFKHEFSVSYAAALFSQTKLFNRNLVLQQRQRTRQEVPLPIEKKLCMKEPSSWTEYHALQDSNNSQNNNMPPNGLGLALEPDFNMLLQMGSQMMFPPSFPTPEFTYGNPITYPSQMNDMYGSRPRGHHSHSRNHPYEQDRHRDHSHKDNDRRDYGRSHRHWDTSSVHYQRERRDKRDRHH